MTIPVVKICGLCRREDAQVAEAAGATYGGVILAPGGKRTVSAAEAVRVFDGVGLRRVGVFVDAPLEEVRRTAGAVGLEVVQLHGAEPVSAVRALRSSGEVTVWKAIRPRSEADLLDAVDRYGGEVDGLLLDGWSGVAAGGTGTSFPWEILAANRARIPAEVAVIVAGGLTVDNVAAAVALLRPQVVDVSSGVELSPGVKDPTAVPAFVAAARGPAL